ncbi:nck-associated protein 5-like isoform X2 [Stigmatopora argus]
MRTMSDEAEQRARDEDFCSDEEADVESYLEDNCGDLVDRLKELEAENSALILANESQREAYERCLDEVANHVVQALLNQKDLREECIKLKMLVFDLEKQNRALCELFQQKLPHHPTAHYQVQAGPLLDYNVAPHNDSAKHLEAAQSEAQAKGNGYRPQHPSLAPSFPGGPAGPAASMEALSPFFKKKAHILEVLRKMEETDPLKFHPATSTLSSLSFCDYSQALASTDAVLSRPTPDLRRCPRSDAVNGGGAAVCEGGNACCLHCKRTPDALTPTPQAVQELSGFLPAPPSEDEPPSEPEPARADAPVSPSPSSCLSEVKAAAMGSPSKLLKLLKLPSTGDKAPPPDPGVRLSPQLTRSSRIPCRTNTYEVYHSPVPARRATTAERCRQPPPPPPTRSESYPAARATATTPPPPRPDDAHQDDFYASEAKAPPGRSPRATATVPLYENVRDSSSSSSNGRRAGDGEPAVHAVHAVHAPEKRTTLPTPAKTSCGERKLVKSLPLATSQQNPSSSSSSSSDEDDSDGPSWVDRPQTPEGADPPNRRPPPPPPPARRNESSSIPKRPATASKSPADSGHHAFKDRLAALGKLRVSDGDSPGGREPETAEPRLSKYQDSPDGRTRGGAKPPGAPTPSKREPKAHAGPPSPNADAPQVLRNHIRCPGSLHLPHDGKPGGTPAPNKIPAKSPSKPAPHRAAGKPAEAPRYASKSAERSKTGGGVGGVGRKNPLFGDSLPPPPPRPPPEGEKTTVASGSQLTPTDPQSAIEQKVMKGIEENMLKLQGGASPIVAAAAAVAASAGGGEAKHKASNGIAGWFGRKKSKLPALSRKAKDERRDWRIHIPAVGKEAPLKMAAGEGVEGLTISTLMEKAEGLRRALEEERAYVERSGRGHSCRVVVDRAQGQLAVMYRGGGGGGGGGGGRSDNFMQQLLNRVDGKEVTSAPPRRLSFDCKRAPSLQSGHASSAIAAGGDDESQKASRRAGDVTSDEKRSVRSAHFADSGASTYTLDSGIGTFPLPDGAPSKAKADPRRPPGSSGRRSRTLDREPPSQEDADWHRRPAVANAPPTEGRRSAVDVREDPVYSTHSKTWTFPNLKTPAEVYLAVEEEGEEVLSLATPYRTSVKGGGVSGGASSSHPADPPGSPAPPPSGMGRRVAKGPPELGRDAGLELLRERPEEALSPGRPTVPETPESLSDSLYDSLSSCGSQG